MVDTLPVCTAPRWIGRADGLGNGPNGGCRDQDPCAELAAPADRRQDDRRADHRYATSAAPAP